MLNDELTKHEFIVIGREHYNPLGIIRSLGEAGLRPVVIIIKGARHFVESSKYISKHFFAENDAQAFDILKHYCSNLEYRPFVYVTDDFFLDYADNFYDEIKDSFYITNAGTTGRIRHFMNKETQNQLAMKHGIKVPKSEVVKTGELPKTLKYPIITKAIASTSGAWKADSFVCYSEKELLEAYSKIKGKTMLLQEFVTRKGEFNIDGFAVNHGESVFLSMITKFLYLVEGRYTGYMDVLNVPDDSLASSLKGMIKDMGYEGIFDGEFMIGDDDEVYFLEVNPRPNAFNYTSTRAGMNCPFLWAKGMLEGSVSKQAYAPIPKGFKYMVETLYLKDLIKDKKINIFKWLKDFITCDCHAYFNTKDIKPFFNFIFKH